MKVIKPGRKQKGWARECRCTGDGNGGFGCGAVLLVEQGDVYLTFSNHASETDTYHTFTCPECGVETDISNPPPGDYPKKQDWLATERPSKEPTR